jgi:hypothetical protein
MPLLIVGIVINIFLPAFLAFAGLIDRKNVALLATVTTINKLVSSYDFASLALTFSCSNNIFPSYFLANTDKAFPTVSMSVIFYVFMTFLIVNPFVTI